jgi:hypothetical protein
MVASWSRVQPRGSAGLQRRRWSEAEGERRDDGIDIYYMPISDIIYMAMAVMTVDGEVDEESWITRRNENLTLDVRGVRIPT